MARLKTVAPSLPSAIVCVAFISCPVQVLSERDLLGGDSERGPALVGNAEDEEAARAIDAGQQTPA
jgi:hypothetical protein